jgi:hypothetical protein
VPDTTSTPPNLEGLVPTVYPGLDFDTISDDLTLQLQAQFSNVYNDFAVSSLGITLLDIVAYGLDILSFYLDRRATDTYLETARTPAALTTLTRQLGYKIKGAVPATVDLNVLLAGAPPGFLVPMAVGFEFQGPNQIVYSVSQATTIYNPVAPAVGTTIPAIVPCYQGTTITENFVSNGTPNQTFTMNQLPDGQFVAQGSVTVVVGGTTWFEVDFLTYAQTNQFEFEYIDTPPELVFGDGSAGNIPPAGASVVVTYTATLGQAGTISASTGNNTIISGPVSPLAVNFQTIPLNVTNPSSGPGFNAESTAHIQATAPFAFNSRNVAVTGSDYFAQANSFADPVFGTVAAAEAISARTAAQDLQFQQEIYQLSSDVQSQQATINTLGTTTSNSGLSAVTVGIPSGGNVTISGLTGGVFTQTSLNNGSQLRLSGLNNGVNNGIWPIIGLVTGSTTSVIVGNASAKAEGPTQNVTWAEINGTLGNVVENTADIAAQVATGQSLVTGSGNIGPSVASMLSALQTALTTLNSGDVPLLNQQLTTLGLVSGGVSTISSNVSTTAITIAGISVSVSPNNLTDATYLSLLSSLTAAQNAITTVTAQLSSIIAALGTGTPGQALKTDLAALSTTLGTATSTTIPKIQGQLGTVTGTTPNLAAATGSVFYALNNDQAALTADASTISTKLTQLVATTNTGTIGQPGYVACYDQILNTQFANGFGDIYAIQQHLDTIESADCNSNVISVPILAQNASGFYTAPSVALVQALQNYLDSIKEVTQTPIVVDGSGSLILSGVNLVYGYTGTTQTLAQNSVQAALDGLYKGRAFGQSLYVSDIDTTIRAVPNIVYCNIVQIFAFNALTLVAVPLDQNGNLLITTNQVITEDSSLNLFTPVLVNSTSTTSV